MLDRLLSFSLSRKDKSPNEPPEPEPERDPTGLPAEKLNRAASHALQQCGLTRRRAEAFFRQALVEYQRSSTHCLLRSHGTLLSERELRERGLHANSKFSREFYDGLNEKGQENPLRSETRILLSFGTALINFRTLYDAQRLTFDKLSISRGSRCCSKVKKLPDTLSAVKAPDLPLLPCDAERCECFYQFDFGRK